MEWGACIFKPCDVEGGLKELLPAVVGKRGEEDDVRDPPPVKGAGGNADEYDEGGGGDGRGADVGGGEGVVLYVFVFAAKPPTLPFRAAALVAGANRLGDEEGG